MRSNSNHIKDRHSGRVLFNEVIVQFLLSVLYLALFCIYNPKSVSLSQKLRRSAFFFFSCFPQNTAISLFEHRLHAALLTAHQ